jgi:hypothetical protein
MFRHRQSRIGYTVGMHMAMIKGRGRRLFRSCFAAAGVIALALTYVLTRPWLDPGYGVKPIDLGNGKKVYLKRLDSGAVGPERLWLSEDPRRCAGFPDPQRDYISQDSYGNSISYRVEKGRLVIYDSAAWDGPTLPSTMPVDFPLILDRNTAEYLPAYRKVMRGLSEATVSDVRQCSRFPDGLVDGTWRDWFN